MTDICKKCGNSVMPPRSSIGQGDSSQPCPVCGEQHYSFAPTHMQQDGGAEIIERRCGLCREVFEVDHHGERKFCDFCLSIIRSRNTTARNRRRREAGEHIWVPLRKMKEPQP